MNNAIESRELFALGGSAAGIRGTYHKVRDTDMYAEQRPVERSGVGVVFLNSLSPTRAANGDLAVYLADAFAKCGYPSFRIDLPGFGDADGDPPHGLHDFINRGDFASVGSGAITQLAARYGLSRMIVVGHCAGALNALYTAGASKECCGLIMTSPYFYLPPASIRPNFRRKLSVMALRSRFCRYLRYIYDGLSVIRVRFHELLQSRPARVVRRGLDRLKDMFRVLRRDVLPENANRNLLRCWKDVSSSGYPILVLLEHGQKAATSKVKTSEFDYIQHILDVAGPKGNVSVRYADGADHSLANRVGRTSVQYLTKQWLNAYFSHANSGVSGASSSPAEMAEGYEIVHSPSTSKAVVD